MGLIGGMARTAVVAGTATAVSNRVSRRQANRWAAKRSHKKSCCATTATTTRPARSIQPGDMLDALQKLGELKSAGSSPGEFQYQKARIGRRLTTASEALARLWGPGEAEELVS